MRKNLRFFAVMCVIVISAFSVLPVFAVDYDVSYGVEILRQRAELKKCGVINSDVTFNPSEFEEILGEDFEYLTITSLPSTQDGALKIGGIDVLENQTISKKNISKLKFVPKENTRSHATFTFKDVLSKNSENVCTLNILETPNFSPVTSEKNIKTLKNISVFDFLQGYDPEQDSIKFKIVSYPKNGTISLENSENGYFCYKPYENFCGKDSIEYCVEDEYGNASAVQTMNIIVEKSDGNIYFADMVNHWAHASAVKVASMGFLSGTLLGGQRNFYPEEYVTKGDFLAMAMIATGYEPKVKYVSKSIFADDADIPDNIRSYAAAAYDMGIISGVQKDDGIYFESDSQITRAQAGVILEALLDTPKPVIAPVFLDFAKIPSYAEEALENLAAYKIINGNGSGNIAPEEIVTRAQSAQMLCNAMEYTREKEKEKNLFNLFGLLK